MQKRRFNISTLKGVQWHLSAKMNATRSVFVYFLRCRFTGLTQVEPSPIAFVGGGRQALNRPCYQIIELKA